MKRNSGSLTLLLILTAAFFGGCSEPSSTSPADTGQKLTVADAVHGEQQVPVDPKRIVSFDYGALDTLLTLGAEDKVVGLPKSNLPKILEPFADQRYADVGTLFEPNFELLFELKPDLIIVSGRAAAKIQELRKIAPTIFLEPKNDDYYASFRENAALLGRILDREAKANEKLTDLDKKLTELNRRVEQSGKTGLISLYTGGKISVYGPQSRFGILHQSFGIKPADPNIKEAAQHGQVVNFEYIKQIDPDYLFVMDRAQILGEETLAKTFLDNDVIRSTKAFKNGAVIYLDTEVWYTVSGGLTSMERMIAEIDAIVK